MSSSSTKSGAASGPNVARAPAPVATTMTTSAASSTAVKSISSANELKAALKEMKGALDTNADQRLLDEYTPIATVLKGLDLKDPKLQSLIYTYHAFIGLAQLHQHQLSASEETFIKATQIQPDQYPAYKGLYDVYTANGSNEKLVRILPLLVQYTPVGLKRLGYQTQLIRMQIEAIQNNPTRLVPSSPTNATTTSSASSTTAAKSPSLTDLQSTTQSILSDPLLAVPADSKDPVKDGAEVKRIQLECHTILIFIAELLEQQSKSKELSVRLERQLKKYRDEKIQSDKIKAQQAASKAGAIAAAVKSAKGAPIPLTQAEEEAEIIRKVTLKLDKDTLGTLEEQKELDLMYAKALTLPSPQPAGLDFNHQLIHERILQRLIQRIQVFGAWTTSLESFTQAQQQIESAATQLLTLSSSSSTPSSYAYRILVGLRWSLGGIIGQSESIQTAALERQTFFEKAITVMSNDPQTRPYAWMAWHALASSIVSTEIRPSIPLPTWLIELQASSSTSSSSSSTSVFELAELILKNIGDESLDASNMTPPIVPTSVNDLTPLIPTYLSSLTLAYALQRQGESKHKECLTMLQQSLNALKLYKATYPHDTIRTTRAMNYLELTLATAYSTKVLDDRILETAIKIYQRILDSTRSTANKDPFDNESQMRSLKGLIQCALLSKPEPNYAQADVYVSELTHLTPKDDFVWSTRGLLKYESAMRLKQHHQDGWQPLLTESEQYFLTARQLAPTSPQHAIRLARVLWEQTTDTKTDPDARTRTILEETESLAANALALLPSTTSVAAKSLQSLQADALGLLGLWHREIGGTVDMAKKFFIRALKIDPSNEVAGEALSAILMQATINEQGETVDLSNRIRLVRSLAHAAVQANPRCLWGWRRLGRCQFSVGAFPAAVVSFQNALRIDGTSEGARVIWEELADCYNAEGQFVAAFKAMSRCVELDMGATDSLSIDRINHRLHLAQCQLNMGAIAEAITTLESIVDLTRVVDASLTPFIPSIKLLAESLYVQANVHSQTGAFQAAMTTLDRAITVVQYCISALNASTLIGDRHYIGVWKLLGDCYALYHSLPTDLVSAATESTAALPTRESRKLTYLQLSTRAYMKVAHLNPTISESWYDSAINQMNAAMNLHAPTTTTIASTSTEESLSLTSASNNSDEALLRQRGLTLIQSALLLTPQNTCYWHLLALLDQRPLVRQHALAQAVTYEPRDAMGWTALGCFYLQQYHLGGSTATSSTSIDERAILLGLSRHALEVSQTLDPSNPSLWTSQGLFNLSVASLEAYVQSKACFIRSLELHPTQLARFGLAYTAYCTGDTSTASFAIRKFTEQYPLHATAWNLAGLIWEHVAMENERARSGTGHSHALESVQAFLKAEELLLLPDSQFDATRKLDLLRMVRVNRARVSVTAKLFPDAIAIYQSLIQDAALSAQSGLVSTGSVLASALTLHVDLTLAYTKSGAIGEAINVLNTAVAISAQQIMSVTPVETDPTAAAATHQPRDDFIRAHRRLLLQQAQLYAMNKEYDRSKQLLQQSVSEYPEHPHPIHYFHTMTALYALSLQQQDMATVNYAMEMMSQCMNGLLSSEQSEEVMGSLQITFYRIQAHVAVLANDRKRAARLYQKMIQLDPTSMISWNEFYQFIIDSQSSASVSTSSVPSLSVICSSATLPTLDFIHINRLSFNDFFQRLELLALTFLQVGRTNDHRSSVPVDEANLSSGSDERDTTNLWKSEQDLYENDETEYVEDDADADVRAKGVNRGSQNNDQDVWPHPSNLNSNHLSSMLLHLDPTSTNSWGIKAFSVYSQAIELHATNAQTPLFTKAITLLQLYTTLLTQELSGPNVTVALRTAATLDLYNSQILLVDCYLRRQEANDLQLGGAILQSIVEQQKLDVAAFPLTNSLVWLMFARLSLASGDLPIALKYYRTSLEHSPLSIDIWEELATVYSDHDSILAGEACLQAALTLLKAESSTPRVIALIHRVYLRLSYHYYSCQQYDRGVEFAQYATRETGTIGEVSITGFFLLGLNQVALNHPDQAMRAFQQALNLQLSSTETSTILSAYHSYPVGQLKFQLGLLFQRTPNSLTESHQFFLDELTNTNLSVSKATIYYQLALTSLKLNDTVHAHRYLDTALRLRPDAPAYQSLQQQLHSTTSTSSPTAVVEPPSPWDDDGRIVAATE